MSPFGVLLYAMTAERAAYSTVHRRARCEPQIPGVCVFRNEHAHHRRMRSQRGRTDLDNLLATCNRCHWAIHNPPPHAAERWAYRHGLLVPSWLDPADVPPYLGCPLTCTTDHTGVDTP